jgi:hypothetical protein
MSKLVRFTDKPLNEAHKEATLNQRVPGSSPGAPTNKINPLMYRVVLDLPKIRRWEGHGKIHQRLTVKGRGGTSAEAQMTAAEGTRPRALALLNSCVGGCTEALMLANGCTELASAALTPAQVGTSALADARSMSQECRAGQQWIG